MRPTLTLVFGRIMDGINTCVAAALRHCAHTLPDAHGGRAGAHARLHGALWLPRRTAVPHHGTYPPRGLSSLPYATATAL